MWLVLAGETPLARATLDDMVRRSSVVAGIFVALAVLACGSSESARRGGSSGGQGGGAGNSTSGGSGGDAMQGGSAGDSARGGQGGSDGGAGGTLPGVNEFCELWIDEFAAYMERCACDPAAVEHYRETAAALCEPTGFLGSLPAAVAAGDLTFDGQAALALFDRLREPDPECVEEPFRALKLDSVELYSLAGAFVGTRALGEACAYPVGFKGGISDCRQGVCASDGAEAGVCIALVGLGEDCDSSGDENLVSTVPRLCHERRLADVDGEYESAFDSLLCAASARDPAFRRCVNDRADGAACRSSEVCRSGLCRASDTSPDGVCSPKLADGEPCQGHYECASGACQNAAPRVCGAPLADGEACDYADYACASGFCSDLVGIVCVPPATLAPGETCTLSTECISKGHGNSRDATCQAGRCVNDICAEYSE
jgi:hypothetical protein